LDAKDKIYWHDAHFSALQLELHEYKDLLEFDNEYYLSKEALRMDTLIIKKNKDVQIDKNIGKIFKTHNIVEYKSEQVHFSLWDFERVMGYAHIYASFEQVPISAITISVSLTIYPKELIKNLENERGYTVQDCGNGIYYIIGAAVPIQIIESKNLLEEDNLFLRNLRSNLSPSDMYKTMKIYKEIEPHNEKNVFIDRIVKANPTAYKEAVTMFTEGIRDIFLEGAEEYGWLNNRDKKRDIENYKKIAKKLLSLGVPPEKVTEATELPFDTVLALEN